MPGARPASGDPQGQVSECFETFAYSGVHLAISAPQCNNPNHTHSDIAYRGPIGIHTTRAPRHRSILSADPHRKWWDR
jgi:hypothetical protein